MAFDSLANYMRLLVFVFVSSCSLSVNGEIDVIPELEEAATGVTVTLFCRSSAASLVWHHTPVGSSSYETVYQDGFIFNGYKGRYSVNMTNSGECNLVISNVKTTDAGRFTCMEKSEDGAQKSAELIVFEQYPLDKSGIAKLTCDQTCDISELICQIKWHGNIVPFMEWRETKYGAVLPSNISILNGVTISSVQLKKRQTDALSYTCQVKYPTDSKKRSQFSWSYSSPATVTVAEENKLQNQSNAVFFIAVIVVMGIIICVLVVFILIYWYFSKQIRKPNGHINNDQDIRRNESYLSQDVESHVTICEPEGRSLLLEADDDVKKAVFEPCTSQNKNNAIHGFGILGNEVFLMTRQSGVIEVFDLYSAKYKRAWIVDGLTNPNDMATCAFKKHIFICDWKQADEDIEIFCADNIGHLKSRWISENDKARISVTKKGNVIVATCSYFIIREYTWSGQLIKKLDMGKEKLHLWHALKLDDEYFVASIGDVHDEIQEICVFKGKGKILHSIKKDSLTASGISLSVPRSLAVDKSGNIFVCDLFGGRIIELTSELQYKGIFEVTENEDRLRCPLRVCISESGSNRYLLVADSLKENNIWKDGRILVWNLNAESNE